MASTASIVGWVYGAIFAYSIIQYVYRLIKWKFHIKLPKWGTKPSDKLYGKVRKFKVLEGDKSLINYRRLW